MTDDRNISYNEAEWVEVIPTPSLNLPDIVAERCMTPKDGSPYFVFFCRPSGKYQHGCMCCGSIGIVGHGNVKKPRIVHDVNIGINRVDLVITVPRYYCNDCNASFSHSFDSVFDKHHTTRRLYEQIQRDAFSRTFTEVAADFGYTEGTVRSFFDAYAAELEAGRGPIIAPRVLGLDEKHIVNMMRGVFVDIETGRLLEMTENNKANTITAAIESMVDYDKNIEIVTTDMANGYRSCVQLCLPKAKLIVDKYHVYQELSRRITKAKALIMEDIKQQIAAEPDKEKADHLQLVRDLIIRNAYLFKFGKKKLSQKTHRMTAMADVCQTFPQFNHLRLIKQGFERIYEESRSRQEAESLYKEWVELIPPKAVQKIAVWENTYHVEADLYDELRAFYRTTQKWYEEIFNYFNSGCQFTNAAAEGTNSLIQRINSQGSGYGFRTLRAKALFCSNSGSRITYSLKKTSIPIYGPSKNVMKKVTPGSFGHPFDDREIVGYTTIANVVEEPSSPKEHLSVLAYIDEQSEFYDFEEG